MKYDPTVKEEFSSDIKCVTVIKWRRMTLVGHTTRKDKRTILVVVPEAVKSVRRPGHAL
jgi:hypothetical protein